MKYWAYMNNEILGPFEKEKLFELPGFEASSLICPQTPVGEKTEDWKEASVYPEVALMFNSPAPETLPGTGQSSGGVETPAKLGGVPPQSRTAPEARDRPESQLLGKGVPKASAADSATGRGNPQEGVPQHPPKADRVTGGTETPEEIKFKPLFASSLEPAAPPPSPENTGIEVKHFGALKSDGEIEHPVTELARSATAGFDSLTLSQIRETTGSISAADSATGRGNPQEGMLQRPPKAASVTAPAVGNQDLESTNFSAAGQPALQPEISENPVRLRQTVDTAALEVFSSKMQTFCETALTRQELNSQLEPLRQMLERMGEALASTDAVQFQRDLLVKLGYLEKAVSEIKSSLSAAAGGKTVAARGSLKPGMIAEAPKKENKQAEIVDSSRKSIRIGLFFKKVSKFLVTLILIAAVALVAVFGLKQFMGFDATRFIPFPIPFLTDNKAAPASAAQSPAEQPQSSGGWETATAVSPQLLGNGVSKASAADSAGGPRQASVTGPQNGQSPEASAKPSAPEQPAAPVKAEPIPPEVIYFIHTYALRPGALTLENTIRQEAAKAGWDSDKLNWENCTQPGSTPEAGKFQAAPGAYAIAAVIPSKDGKSRLSFFYEVDTKLATVKPLDEIGKTAMEILISASALKTRPEPGTLKNGRQARRAGARTKVPAKAQTRQTAPRTQTPPSDEYEYVDEEDTGQ